MMSVNGCKVLYFNFHDMGNGIRLSGEQGIHIWLHRFIGYFIPKRPDAHLRRDETSIEG